MLPLRADVPRKTFPLMNWALVLANAGVFFHELALAKGLDRFILRYAIVPSRFAKAGMLAQVGPYLYLRPLFTSMFLHGGWMHLIGNMWFLIIFGAAVEDRVGHLRYLFFYLLCGMLSGATQISASWGSSIPTIGASGAIAGVLGAFFILYPFSRVTTLVPLFIFVETFRVPASLFLGFWLWMQIYSGRMAMNGAGELGGVAWWAHVGGFVVGVVLLGVFIPGKERRSYA